MLVLRFQGIELSKDVHSEGTPAGWSLDVLAGRVALVLVPLHAEVPPFGDLATGMLEPDAGRVEFLGESWANMTDTVQCDRRAMVGRVFDGQGWISNLTVLDNVLLAQWHHTARLERDLNAEADRLARMAGLDEVPDRLPELVPRPLLRRAEWVRALMGSPRLIVLERPDRDADEAAIPKLVAMVEGALRAGAAVLWVTQDRDFWKSCSLAGLDRYTIHGGRLAADSGG